MDLRRTIRASLGSGGQPLQLCRQARPDRSVRIVALLDVSGSMEPCARTFLAFLAGLMRADPDADAWLFHTRLVRITEALRDVDPLRALSRITLLADGFGGGSRIGAIETEATRLRAQALPYAVATVVRTLAATSAKPGARALVLADGSIAAGLIGGACARSAVARAALVAIGSGQPQYVSLRPEEVLEAEGVQPGEERDGIRFARNGCSSKGSMDIFVEPVLPQPRLAILGAGPVAQALCDVAGRFDLHRTLQAPGLVEPALADVVQGGFDLAALTGGSFVVATQGRGDEAALRAALRAGAAQVAFVGSRRKFATLTARLAAAGADPAALAAVAAPAGLDIYAITPEEIALSILAQVVGWRRSGTRGTLAPETARTEAGKAWQGASLGRQ